MPCDVTRVVRPFSVYFARLMRGPAATFRSTRISSAFPQRKYVLVQTLYAALDPGRHHRTVQIYSRCNPYGGVLS